MINHTLLKRQLKKANLSVAVLPEILEEWKYFLSLVDKSYSDSDQDRYIIERSIEISSREMRELNDALKAELSEIHLKDALLMEEKKYISEILDSVPGLFYFFDEQGCTIRWNKNVEQVCGYSPEELPKMHALDFFQATDKRRVSQYIEKIFLDGWGNFEAYIVYKNQTKVPYFLSGKVSNYKGKKCILGMGYEISERKAAESKLLERIEELSRWHAVTLDREGRILELKNEVNQLLHQAGQSPRYPSVVSDSESIKDS